jgi:hypothetical protein
MRFSMGQVYECSDSGRQAVVAQVSEEGRAGLLRFLDTGGEEWFLWPELHQAGKWHLKD